MTRRNRVDPWGDLHAVAARGLLTGNRGCLVDDDRRRRPPPPQHDAVDHVRDASSATGASRSTDPHRWTPIFFLDEAVALAAGHRPCALLPPRRLPRLPRRRRRRRRPLGRRARSPAGVGATASGTRPVPRRRSAAVAGAVDVAPRRHGRRRRRPAAVPADRRDAAAVHVRRLVSGDAAPPVVDVLTPPTSVAALAGATGRCCTHRPGDESGPSGGRPDRGNSQPRRPLPPATGRLVDHHRSPRHRLHASTGDRRARTGTPAGWRRSTRTAHHTSPASARPGSTRRSGS